jgi:hypothetical protein
MWRDGCRRARVQRLPRGHPPLRGHERGLASFFPQDPPARTTVQAVLAEPEMLVEIEAIAYVEN